MSNHIRALRDAYRAAIGRSRAAGAVLEGLEPGTSLFHEGTAGLSSCLRVEIEAGRTFMDALDAQRTDAAYRRRGRLADHTASEKE
jgi:hypothetical protein